MRFLILCIFLILCSNASASTVIITQYGYVSDSNGHVIGKYDNDINTGNTVNLPNGETYTSVPNEISLDAISIYKDPVQNFSTDQFVQQLAQTSLVSNPELFPYYAVLKDMTFYKNFQGLANLLSSLLQANAINQADVDTVDTALENQQINLDSYNSEVNVAY